MFLVLNKIFFALILFVGACSAFDSKKIENKLESRDSKASAVSNSVSKNEETSEVVDLSMLETTEGLCRSPNAQEAWLGLGSKKPSLEPPHFVEIYFYAEATKMLALSQSQKTSYGEPPQKYIEVSYEKLDRGSRQTSFAQVIATRSAFMNAQELYSSLPSTLQESVKETVPALVVQHQKIKNQGGYIKTENDIVVELAMKLEHGQEIRCRASEACVCL